MACDEGDTDLAGGYGSDVGLCAVGPIDLDLIRPGRYDEVLAESDASGGD